MTQQLMGDDDSRALLKSWSLELKKVPVIQTSGARLVFHIWLHKCSFWTVWSECLWNFSWYPLKVICRRSRCCCLQLKLIWRSLLDEKKSMQAQFPTITFNGWFECGMKRLRIDKPFWFLSSVTELFCLLVCCSLKPVLIFRLSVACFEFPSFMFIIL